MMKKWIALLLAAVMCLSLCACGGIGGNDNDKDDGGSKYADLIAMLDEGRYADAMMEIARMANEAAGNVETPTDTDTLKQETAEILKGTWMQTYAPENKKTEITFTGDGTCQIGGVTYPVVAEEYFAADNRFYHVGSEYRVSVSATEKGGWRLNLSHSTDQMNWNTVGQYMRMEDFDVVEITMDNISQYFEYVEVPNFKLNAFNESEGFTLTGVYTLKEEYADKVMESLSNVAVGYKRTLLTVSFTYDPAAQTYAVGDTVKVQGSSDQVAECNMFGLSSSGGRRYYGFTVGTGGNSYGHDDQLSNFPAQPELQRVAGTLYLYK